MWGEMAQLVQFIEILLKLFFKSDLLYPKNIFRVNYYLN